MSWLRNALAPLSLRNLKLSVAYSVRSLGFCVGTGSTTLPLFTGDSGHASITLSKATRLKSVTPKHRDLRQILINVPFDFPPGSSSVDIRRAIGETTYGLRPPSCAVLGVTFNSSKDKAQRRVAEREERCGRLCTAFVARDDEESRLTLLSRSRYDIWRNPVADQTIFLALEEFGQSEIHV